MPTQIVGHHGRPSPEVSEFGHGNHTSDGLPKRVSKAPGPLEARDLPRGPSSGASPPSPSHGDNAGFVSLKQERFRLREASWPLLSARLPFPLVEARRSKRPSGLTRKAGGKSSWSQYCPSAQQRPKPSGADGRGNRLLEIHESRGILAGREEAKGRYP